MASDTPLAPRWLLALLSAALLPLAACDGWSNTDDDDSAGDDDAGDDDTGDDDAGDDDDTVEDPCDGADPTDPCCVDPLPQIFVCAPDLPSDQVFTGTFSSWELGTVEFVTVEGSVHEFQIDGHITSFVLLPDLAGVQLSLVQQFGDDGDCGGDGPRDSVLYVYREVGDDEELELLIGSTSSAHMGGWTINSPSNTASCLARPGGEDACNEFVHNRPFFLTHDIPDPHELYQGTEALIDGFDVMVTVAQSGSGSYNCPDGPGLELDNWLIRPHVE